MNINVCFVLSDNGAKINVQTKTDALFAELAMSFFNKSDIKQEDKPTFIYCSQQLVTDSCKTLAELNIHDGSRIEVVVGKIIGA